MKKIMTVIMLAASGLLFSAYVPEMTRTFSLQAGYAEAAAISITPVVAQSQAYIAGMPFNIEDRHVHYGVTSLGREIAHWDVLCNTDFNIKVEGSKMVPVNADGTVKSGFDMATNGLDYYLVFQYTLGYDTADGNTSSTTRISTYHSKDASTGEFTNLTSGYDRNSGEFIGGVDGTIFFCFDEESTDWITGNGSDSLPAGDYQATVTITLEKKS